MENIRPHQVMAGIGRKQGRGSRIVVYTVGRQLTADRRCINGFCMGLTMCAGFKPAVGSIVQVDDVEVEVELEAAVLHRAHVDECLVVDIRRNRHCVVAEQILLAAVEVVE